MMKNKKRSNLRFKARKKTKAYFPIRLFLKLFLTGVICLVLFKNGSAYANTFKKVGKITGVNYKILVSVAYVESGLNPYSVDVDGRAYFFKSRESAEKAVKRFIGGHSSVDIGIMQVNYEIWGRYLNLTIKQLLNPKINILIGAYILRHYVKKYGYSWKTIARYHSADYQANYNYRKKIKYIYGLIGKNK